MYELSSAELAVLGRCCRTVDVLARIDEELIGSDLVVEGSVGQLRAHPLLAVKAEQERVLDALLRALALPMPDEDLGRRRSPAASAAAQARWRAQRSGEVAAEAGRIEAPAWYRMFDPGGRDEPDEHEQRMIDGSRAGGRGRPTWHRAGTRSGAGTRRSTPTGGSTRRSPSRSSRTSSPGISERRQHGLEVRQREHHYNLRTHGVGLGRIA